MNALPISLRTPLSTAYDTLTTDRIWPTITNTEMQDDIHSHTKWDIFLAHAAPDREYAETLFARLTEPCLGSRLLRIFLDSRSLKLGDDWDIELVNAQQNSKVTVVIVSGNTERAYYQREEIAAAIAMAREDHSKHRVVPLLIEDGPRAHENLPYGLRLKHGISISGIVELKDVASRLRELIQDIDQIPAPGGGGPNDSVVDHGEGPALVPDSHFNKENTNEGAVVPTPVEEPSAQQLRKINILLLSTLVVAVNWWFAVHTNGISVVFGVTLLGIISTIPLFFGYIPKRIPEALQESFWAFLASRTATRALVLAAAGLAGTASFLGSVAITSSADGTVDIYRDESGDDHKSPELRSIKANEPNRFPLFTPIFSSRSYRVKVSGHPFQLMKIKAWQSSDFDAERRTNPREVMLLVPGDCFTFLDERRFSIQVEGKSFQVTYTGNPLWFGCTRDVRMPDKARQMVEAFLANCAQPAWYDNTTSIGDREFEVKEALPYFSSAENIEMELLGTLDAVKVVKFFAKRHN